MRKNGMTILLLVFRNHSLSVRKIPDHPFENFIKLNDQQIIALALLPYSIKQIIISPINITNRAIFPTSCRPLTEYATGSFHFLFKRILSSLPDSQSSTASPAVFQAATFKYRIWYSWAALHSWRLSFHRATWGQTLCQSAFF